MGAAVLVIAGAGVAVAQWHLDGFDRVGLDLDTARDRLDAATVQTHDGPGDVPFHELDLDVEIDGLLTTLILGSDATSPDEGDVRADAILLVVVPPDGTDPVLASIPRDLWVENPCTGEMSRINEGLSGCGDDVSGPELMAIMVEDLAGVRVDHYAEVDFDGFVRIVDAFGGVEICTEHPVRDARAELELPGGCVDASGEDALAWARSRRTQEYVDGRWRMQPGVNALSRDERQQDILLRVADRISSFESAGRLRAVAFGLQDAVVLDDGMSLTRAVALAWKYRSIDPDDVRRVTIPVVDHTTSGGAAVLRPQASLAELLTEELGKDPEELAGNG